VRIIVTDSRRRCPAPDGVKFHQELMATRGRVPAFVARSSICIRARSYFASILGQVKLISLFLSSSLFARPTNQSIGDAHAAFARPTVDGHPVLRFPFWVRVGARGVTIEMRCNKKAMGYNINSKMYTSNFLNYKRAIGDLFFKARTSKDVI